MKYNTDLRSTEHSQRKIRATLTLDINDIQAPINRETMRTSMPIHEITALKYLNSEPDYGEN